MATVNKDFRVKNGLQVNGTGSFGGAVVVGSPTIAAHATTKEYVDSVAGGVTSGSTPPASPNDGKLWLDTLTQRVNVYYDGVWITLAAIDDTLTLPDHIHDTSIDGNGLIVSQFISSGFMNAPQGSPVEGGDPSTSIWTATYDGGVATDNFN